MTCFAALRCWDVLSAHRFRVEMPTTELISKLQSIERKYDKQLTAAFYVGNGWEWGLLGLLLILIVDHSLIT